jgi:hypothetical protein
MCMNVIRVGLEMGNYSHVTNYIAKAEQVVLLLPPVSLHPVSAPLTPLTLPCLFSLPLVLPPPDPSLLHSLHW